MPDRRSHMKLNCQKLASFFALMLFAMLIGITSVQAQTANTGALTGVVKNERGELVPNATVRAIKIGTNTVRETTTSGEGSYEIAQLVPGDYRVEVEASGFAKFVQEPVTVNVLSRVTLEPVVRPEGATAQVNITSEATLVETTKTEVSGLVDQRQMENLPVNGRSFASLAVLIPGATLAPSFDPTKARVGTFSIGGSSGRNLNITID